MRSPKTKTKIKSKVKKVKNRKLSKKAGVSKKKRPLNNYFKMMLSAKKQNMNSFKYNGKTYKGTRHKHLGMIYKKL